MSSPTYPHPGPSSYYQQHPPPPPPPHYMYGTHSPGPYSYPYPGHALGHLPPVLQSPSSPARLNGTRGSYIPHSPSSSAQNYQNLHPTQHYIQPQQIHSPHAQPYHHRHPHSIPYSPTYPPFSPSWSAHQPLSPLPKQLSMPPPPRDMSPLALPFQQPLPLEIPLPQSNNQIKSPPPPSDPQPSPSSPRTTSHRKSSSQVKFEGWPILSRRPNDPARAPGVAISPLARPPDMIPEMILRALKLLTPSTRPKAAEALAPAPKDDGQTSQEDATSSSEPEHDQDANSSSVTTETTPASSTAPDTPMQGSPLSSTTSISVTGTSPGKNIGSSAVQSPKMAVALPASEVPSGDAPSDHAASTSKAPPPPATKKSWASLLRPASPSSSPSGSKKPNTLPTSSVVGISIPASSSSPATVSPTRKSELLALLTSTGTGNGSAPPPAIRARGLVNSGNMCFANSVLQVLIYCPPFHRLFSELGKLLGEDGEGLWPGTPLVDATIRFLKEFEGESGVVKGQAEEDAKNRGKGKEVDRRGRDEEEEEGDSFIPSYVYDAMKEKKRFDNMRGGQQEDAEEFLGFYLDTLEEELLSIVNSISPPAQPAKVAAPIEEREEDAPPQDDGWLEVGRRNRTVLTRTIRAVESPITRIFEGKFRSTLRAPGQKDSVIIEDWRSLRLDIQREHIHTVQDALAYISHPQSVHVTSPTRGVTIEASQQVLIEALPPILVLHMKRFLYDTGVGGVVKVGRQVRFGPELEVGADVMAPGVRKAQPARYKLFGVLYHHGLSAGGGHYTLDVLHPNRGSGREGWVRVDDDVVVGVKGEDVFAGVERDDRCAYLLFYRRIGVKYEKVWN